VSPLPLIFRIYKGEIIDEKAFLYILSECSKIHIIFSPKKVFADFEKAIHLAILSVWPSFNFKRMSISFGAKLV